MAPYEMLDHRACAKGRSVPRISSLLGADSIERNRVGFKKVLLTKTVGYFSRELELPVEGSIIPDFARLCPGTAISGHVADAKNDFVKIL